jgi:regulator of nonsense transcripts 2
VVLIRPAKLDAVDLEAQADFDREFAKMLVDTTDARRGDRKTAPPVFDSAVPMIKGGGDIAATSHEGKMAFALMTKRGNKSQLRSLEIPLESAIAINALSHQERSKAEQEQLKRLVLQNERRLERSEMDGRCFLLCALGKGIRR